MSAFCVEKPKQKRQQDKAAAGGKPGIWNTIHSVVNLASLEYFSKVSVSSTVSRATIISYKTYQKLVTFYITWFDPCGNYQVLKFMDLVTVVFSYCCLGC